MNLGCLALLLSVIHATKVLHLRLSESHKKGRRKVVRDRIPDKMLLDNAFQAWHEHALIKLQHHARPNKIRIMITSVGMSTWSPV